MRSFAARFALLSLGIAALLVACDQFIPPEPPLTSVEVGRADEGSVERIFDPEYGIVCYIHYRGVSCVKVQ